MLIASGNLTYATVQQQYYPYDLHEYYWEISCLITPLNWQCPGNWIQFQGTVYYPVNDWSRAHFISLGQRATDPETNNTSEVMKLCTVLLIESRKCDEIFSNQHLLCHMRDQLFPTSHNLRLSHTWCLCKSIELVHSCYVIIIRLGWSVNREIALFMGPNRNTNLEMILLNSEEPIP